MVEITLLELELEDANITANAPYSGQTGSTTEEDDEGGATTTDGGGARGKLFAVLLVAAVVGLAMWRMRSGSAQREPEEVVAGD